MVNFFNIFFTLFNHLIFFILVIYFFQKKIKPSLITAYKSYLQKQKNKKESLHILQNSYYNAEKKIIEEEEQYRAYIALLKKWEQKKKALALKLQEEEMLLIQKTESRREKQAETEAKRKNIDHLKHLCIDVLKEDKKKRTESGQEKNLVERYLG